MTVTEVKAISVIIGVLLLPLAVRIWTDGHKLIGVGVAAMGIVVVYRALKYKRDSKLQERHNDLQPSARGPRVRMSRRAQRGRLILAIGSFSLTAIAVGYQDYFFAVLFFILGGTMFYAWARLRQGG